MGSFEAELAAGEAASNARLDALAAGAFGAHRLLHLRDAERRPLDRLRHQALESGALAAFLRANRNSTSRMGLGRIRSLASEDDRPVLAAALDKRLLEKLGIPPPPPIPRRNPLKLGTGEMVFLWAIASSPFSPRPRLSIS
jgi:hypothetical protein